MPIILKSGSLSFLEPSGTVQVCNGIALPLPLLHYLQLQTCHTATVFAVGVKYFVTVWQSFIQALVNVSAGMWNQAVFEVINSGGMNKTCGFNPATHYWSTNPFRTVQNTCTFRGSRKYFFDQFRTLWESCSTSPLSRIIRFILSSRPLLK